MQPSKDVVQLISQYSTVVYCKLRCLNCELKAMVDEVLPNIVGAEKIDHAKKQRKRTNPRENFIARCGHCCGMILLQQNVFDGWINAMSVEWMKTNAANRNLGETIEQFCRNYLPKSGSIHPKALELLCRYNRKDYVRQLWNGATDKQSRFGVDCMESICMLDDLELLKTVYGMVANAMMEDNEDGSRTVRNAWTSRRWSNVSFLLNEDLFLEYRELNIDADFRIAVANWDLFQDLVSLPASKEHAMKILRQKGKLLAFVDESLRKDKEVVMEAVKQNGFSFRYADESLRKDKEVAMEAIKQNSFALQYADESLRKDKEVVMEAVKQNGWTFRYVDASLRNEKEVLMTVLEQNRSILQFSKLTIAAKVAVGMVKRDGLVLEYLYRSLRKDKEVVMEAVKQYALALEYAHESLRKDKEVVLQAVKQYGLALEYADESLRKDKEVVLVAIKQNRNAIRYVDRSIRNDQEFSKNLFKQAKLE